MKFGLKHHAHGLSSHFEFFASITTVPIYILAASEVMVACKWPQRLSKILRRQMPFLSGLQICPIKIWLINLTEVKCTRATECTVLRRKSYHILLEEAIGERPNAKTVLSD